MKIPVPVKIFKSHDRSPSANKTKSSIKTDETGESAQASTADGSSKVESPETIKESRPVDLRRTIGSSKVGSLGAIMALGEDLSSEIDGSEGDAVSTGIAGGKVGSSNDAEDSSSDKKNLDGKVGSTMKGLNEDAKDSSSDNKAPPEFEDAKDASGDSKVLSDRENIGTSEALDEDGEDIGDGKAVADNLGTAEALEEEPKDSSSGGKIISDQEKVRMTGTIEALKEDGEDGGGDNKIFADNKDDMGRSNKRDQLRGSLQLITSSRDLLSSILHDTNEDAPTAPTIAESPTKEVAASPRSVEMAGTNDDGSKMSEKDMRRALARNKLEIDLLERRVEQEKGEVEYKEKNLRKLAIQFRAVLEELELKDKEVNDLAAEKEFVVEERDRLLKEVKDMQHIHQIKSEQEEEMERMRGDHHAAIAAISSQLDGKAKEQEENEQQVEKLKTELESVKRESELREAEYKAELEEKQVIEIANLSKERDASLMLAKTAEEKEKEAKEAKEELKSMKLEAEKHQTAAISMSQEHEERVVEMSSDLNAKSKEIEKLKSDLESIQREAQSHKGEKETLSRERDEHAEARNESERKMEKVSAELESMKKGSEKNRDTHDAELAKLYQEREAQFTLLTSELLEKDKKIEKLVAELEVLKRRSSPIRQRTPTEATESMLSPRRSRNPYARDGELYERLYRTNTVSISGKRVPGSILGGDAPLTPSSGASLPGIPWSE